MSRTKAPDGTNNLCGKQISKQRMDRGLSQRQLADALQRLGMDVGKNTIQRIESGERYVPDYELVFFAKAFGIEISELLIPKDEIFTIL